MSHKHDDSPVAYLQARKDTDIRALLAAHDEAVAEVARMRPVVEAAVAEFDAENARIDATYVEGMEHKPSLFKLDVARAKRIRAVDAYRAQEGK